MVHLDEEIVAVHFEIVELQRSPFARRQVDVMEQLSVSVEKKVSFCISDQKTVNFKRIVHLSFHNQ